MIEKIQTIEMYRNYKDTNKDNIKELNKTLLDLEINCEVMCKEESDGETLIFKKIDI